MKILLDTQVLIWYQTNSVNLNTHSKELIRSTQMVYISDISLIEIAIKKSVNKLHSFAASINDVINVSSEDGFIFLLIKHHHFEEYSKFAYFPQHRDPFDRLIIATAIAENLISADRHFTFYENYIKIIPA